jgi:hypothetical protein
LLCAVGFVLGVAATGIQGCGDGFTESTPSGPTPTPGGTYTIAAAPATVSVIQGGGGESRISIARTGDFRGTVTLAIAGAPAGLTATINPSSTTGTMATLVLTTVAAVAMGTSTLTITGTATGRTDQTTTVIVDIAPYTGGAGNVTVDFSSCAFGSFPAWFAFQDGTGPWTQVLDSADVYRFDIASARGGYASAGIDGLRVSLATRSELTASAILPCGSGEPTKTVSGTLAGLGLNDVVYVSMGGSWTDNEGGPVAASSFTMTGVQDGDQDLIAYRFNPRAMGNSQRVIIRRDQNIANGGTLGTLDFDAPESFAPTTASLTVTGDAGSSPVRHGMSYLAGAGCTPYDLYYDPTTGADFTTRGIPAAHQRATDFHRVVLYTTQTNGIRYAYESFHTLADRVVALPAAVPVPTVTTPPGGHLRIQAALTLPSDYQTALLLLLSDPVVYVTASAAWFGGPSVTLAIPDFSDVTGWRSSFAPAAGASVGWILRANGGNGTAAGGGCVENARSVEAFVSGSS